MHIELSLFENGNITLGDGTERTHLEHDELE